MNRVACILCAICVVQLIGVGHAQDSSEFLLKTNNGTVSIRGYKGTNFSIVIPPSFGGLPVTSVDDLSNWLTFDRHRDVTNVVIPECVTNLGQCLFEGMGGGGLRDVNIPKGLTRIYADTFMSCVFSNLFLSSNLLSIGNNAFVGSEIGRLVISGSITNITGGAFCEARINNLVIPDSVATITTSAFKGAKIKKVVYGNGMQNFNGDPFDYAYVGSIILRAGVKRIDDGGFAWLGGLTNVTFEGDAPETGRNVFGTNQDVEVYYYSGTKGWGATFGGRPTFKITTAESKK